MKKIMFVALALLIGLASCVKDKQYSGIKISDVHYTPAQVTENDDVTVTATISCFKAFTAKLYYAINEEEYTPVVMDKVEGVYTAVIPAQPLGTKVKFYIEAENDELTEVSNVTEYEVVEGGVTPPGPSTMDYRNLILNELNGQDHKKFIEIYNTGQVAINMEGVTIYKDTEKLVWTGSNAVNVEPGAYLLLFSEDVFLDYDMDTTLYMFHSGLSAKKNVRIELKDPDGVTVDDFNLTQIELNGEAYGYANNQAPDSYSRNADGEWYYSDATPGGLNIDGVNPVLGLESGVTPPDPPTIDYSQLILNELNGQDHKKFIEIFNAGNVAINMEGVTIYKDTEKLVWTGSSAVNVEAGDYLLLFSEDVFLDYDMDTTLYMFHSGLSAKKNVRIELKDPDGGTIADFNLTNIDLNGEAYGYANNQAPDSYSRNSDGRWYYSDATPAAINIDGENIVLGLEGRKRR
jgi:hypothetical protein